MCCISTIFLLLISRIAIVVWWLTDPQRFVLAFKNWNLPVSITIPVWVWALLGVIFLPWTTLAYLIVVPGGVVGYDWIWLGVALLVDLAGHSGGYRHRDRIPGYRRN